MSDRLNLADTNSTTSPVPVPPGAAKLSIGVKATTWSTAVVDLQYSLSIDVDDVGTDLTDWQNFSPAVQLSTSTTRLRNVRVSGTGWVRLKVSTAAATADIGAVVTMLGNWNA